MARQRMVTRTITFQEAEVICLNIETAQAQVNLFITASPTPLTIEQLKAKYDTDTVKLVSIVTSRQSEQCYGMTEDDFMRYAHVVTR